MQVDEIIEKYVDAKVGVNLDLILIESPITLPLGLYLYPILKSCNQIRLGSDSKTKQDSYIRHTLTNIENRK
jgi:hypothetical protein